MEAPSGLCVTSAVGWEVKHRNTINIRMSHIVREEMAWVLNKTHKVYKNSYKWARNILLIEKYLLLILINGLVIF